MANPFEKLAPEGFSKIAQNDDRNGDVLAVVYLNKRSSEFFVQLQTVTKEFITLGPLPPTAFRNLCTVLASVQDMEGRYHFIE
jgi:hypothetical protein